MERTKLVALAGGLVALGTGLAAAEASYTVAQKNRQFAISSIVIAVGDTIRFTNQDEFLHQIYVDSPGFSFDSDEQAPGEVLAERFTRAGTFTVRCHIHPTMLLTVTVK